METKKAAPLPLPVALSIPSLRSASTSGEAYEHERVRASAGNKISSSGGGGSLNFSMEALQFAVRKDWSICSFSREAKEQFYPVLGVSTPNPHAKINLRTMLGGLESVWLNDIPEAVPAVFASDRVFLPWDVSRKAHGMGWSLFALQCQKDLYTITLMPAMCPSGEAKLAENSISFDGETLQELLRELFLRTQQQEARFQFFVRHLPGAHFKQDIFHRFTLINAALEELLGSEWVGELSDGAEWLDWIHPNDRAEVVRNLKRCETANLPSSCRFRLLLPDGDRVLHLMELRIPVRGIDGRLNGYEGLWLDFTREELAQQHLQHSSWKDSLAQISGSLSHDFNNMLAGLVSLSELLMMDVQESDPLYEIASLIKNTTNQTKDLSGRIISLNREERGRPQLCNLSDLVLDQLDLIRIVLPKDARIELAIPDEKFPVRMDTVSMRRILVNFATNARDVLEYKGTVRLKMRKIDFAKYNSACLVSNQCKREGEAVEFVFEDNGPGIPPEIISRIFGAYFSTKDCTTTSGSGLGLYCLTEFARDNYFDYGVRTRLGRGTEMVLIFPLVGESEDPPMIEEREEMLDLIHYFKEPPVAFYGTPNAATNAVLAGLERRGVKVCEIADEVDLRDWAGQQDSGQRTLLMAFSYNEHKKARLIAESFEPNTCGLQAILSLQGLNPERFSYFIGDKFDHLMMANAKPSITINKILNHLSTALK
jgi:signal transduction histidine kinase